MHLNVSEYMGDRGCRASTLHWSKGYAIFIYLVFFFCKILGLRNGAHLVNPQHSPFHSDDELIINISLTNSFGKVWRERVRLLPFFLHKDLEFQDKFNGQEFFPFNLEPFSSVRGYTVCDSFLKKN